MKVVYNKKEEKAREEEERKLRERFFSLSDHLFQETNIESFYDSDSKLSKNYGSNFRVVRSEEEEKKLFEEFSSLSDHLR